MHCAQLRGHEGGRATECTLSGDRSLAMREKGPRSTRCRLLAMREKGPQSALCQGVDHFIHFLWPPLEALVMHPIRRFPHGGGAFLPADFLAAQCSEDTRGLHTRRVPRNGTDAPPQRRRGTQSVALHRSKLMHIDGSARGVAGTECRWVVDGSVSAAKVCNRCAGEAASGLRQAQGGVQRRHILQTLRDTVAASSKLRDVLFVVRHNAVCRSVCLACILPGHM